MSIPHIPPHAPAWGLFRTRGNTSLGIAARSALYRIYHTGVGLDDRFRGLVVLRVKRQWTLGGTHYRPVCDPRFLHPIQLPNGLQAFLEDEGAIFVLGRPQYKGRYIPRLSAPYQHTYVPYDPHAHPEIARHLITALDRLAR
jgi:hypothetical protein